MVYFIGPEKSQWGEVNQAYFTIYDTRSCSFFVPPSNKYKCSIFVVLKVETQENPSTRRRIQYLWLLLTSFDFFCESLIINRWHIQNVKPWGTLTRFLLFIIQFIPELAKRSLWLTIVISFWILLVDFFSQIFIYNERKQSQAHEKKLSSSA